MTGKSLQIRSVKSDKLFKQNLFNTSIMQEKLNYFPPLVEVMNVNTEGVLCASGANAPTWEEEEW